MDIENEIMSYNVSRETYDKLVTFVGLLKEWNEKMNLVSKNSIEDIWTRHILDSVQLVDYLPSSLNVLVDIGSGAGFPGVVLAVLLQEKNPQTKIYLVESITKKTVYLNDVCQKLMLKNVSVLNERIENGVFKNVDVVTARAVASLDTLCGYVGKIGNKNTITLLLKGRTYNEENSVACKKWTYDMDVFNNKYGADGVVLKITNLRKKK
jgi:16S rRNA (guanine527-N7)-methyltransferase